MTAASDVPEVDIAALRYRGAVTFLCTYIVLVLVAGPAQLRDPFFHFDDAPALYALADDYWHKAVTEGRWFNYLWHLRDFRFSAPANFQLYLVAWAAFVAAAAVSIFRTGGLRFPVAFAVLVVLGPQTTEIAGWYNSLVPGIWLLAVFAVVTLFLSERASRWWLAVFVPVSLQAYTPYPFLLLGIALMREDRPRRFSILFGVVLLFCLTLAFGLLVVWVMNYALAGDFGIEPHSWRNPTPAEDFAGLIANVPKVAGSLKSLVIDMGFGQPLLSALIAMVFALSFLLVLRWSWNDALAIVAVIGLGLGPLVGYSLLEGIELPFRATSFVWFMLVATMVMAARLWPRRDGVAGWLPLAPLVLLGVCLFVFAAADFRAKSVWQAYVREVVDLVPPETEHILIYGRAGEIARSPLAQSELDLSMYVIFLTGTLTDDCEVEPIECAPFGDPFDGAQPGEEPRIVTDGARAFVMPAHRETVW